MSQMVLIHSMITQVLIQQGVTRGKLVVYNSTDRLLAAMVFFAQLQFTKHMCKAKDIGALRWPRTVEAMPMTRKNFS